MFPSNRSPFFLFLLVRRLVFRSFGINNAWARVFSLPQKRLPRISIVDTVQSGLKITKCWLQIERNLRNLPTRRCEKISWKLLNEFYTEVENSLTKSKGKECLLISPTSHNFITFSLHLKVKSKNLLPFPEVK